MKVLLKNSKQQSKFNAVVNPSSTWRACYCYLNKGEYNLNQSKEDSFVKRVAKINS